MVKVYKVLEKKNVSINMKSKELKLFLSMALFLLLLSRPLSANGFDTLCLTDQSNDVMRGYSQNNQLVALYSVYYPSLDFVKITVDFISEETLRISMEFSAEPKLNSSMYYYVVVEGSNDNYSSITVQAMFGEISLGENTTTIIMIWSGSTQGLYTINNASTHISGKLLYWDIILINGFPLDDFKKISEDDFLIEGVAALGFKSGDTEIYYWDDTDNSVSCGGTLTQSDSNEDVGDNVSETGNLPFMWDGMLSGLIALVMIYNICKVKKRRA